MAAVVWTIRIATALYVIAAGLWLLRRDVWARAAWTAGCALYLAHVAAAFHFVHHWSHRAAYVATERQSGVGAGLYVNYAFTVLWVMDVVWWWRGLVAYRARPRWIAIAIHAFFAFMFFNAVVIF